MKLLRSQRRRARTQPRLHAMSVRAIGIRSCSSGRSTDTCRSSDAASLDRRRGGFTMVEVLIALGVLLFGMTAILGLLTFGAALSRTALLRTTTASLTEAVVADLEESLFPLKDGEAGEPIEIKDRPLPGMPGVIYSARAVPNPSHPIEHKVDIEFSWQSGGVRRERRFSTLILREVPFGTRLRKQFVESKSEGGP